MLAMELSQDLELSVAEREISDPGPGEVLIRVEWAGLCGSDLHVLREGVWVEYWPAVLGHELCGVVETTGPGVSLELGTRVVADSRIPCGACEICASDPDRCPNLRFVGEATPGGFATHTTLPANVLHSVPDELDLFVAVLAEPLAIVLHALSHLAEPPRNALILGHGPIGALVHIELLRRFPEATVTVAEPAPVRAALAESLGAKVHDSGAGSRFDLVVDAAGYPGSLKDAVAACAPGAQLLLVAMSARPVELVPIELAQGRIQLTGCNGFISELPEAIALLVSDGWRYRTVITQSVSLAGLPDAARRQLESPDAIKVVVRP